MAVSCPVSQSQLPYYHSLFRGNDGQPNAPVVPNIPIASDLPSLIRTVNMMSDVLRQYTSSKTVNNLYLPRPPNFKSEGNKYYSQYPHWEHVYTDIKLGYVFHKDKDGKKDPTQRVYVQRQNACYFYNQQQDDRELKWSYTKNFDANTVTTDADAGADA